MVGTAKMQIAFTETEITSDYVLEALFQISEKSKNLNHATIAKEIIKMASKRGQEGLHSSDWKKQAEELGIKSHVYFAIIKKLKDAGILRKTNGRYYVIHKFQDHLSRMASAMNDLYIKLGIDREEK